MIFRMQAFHRGGFEAAKTSLKEISHGGFREVECCAIDKTYQSWPYGQNDFSIFWTGSVTV